MSQLEEDERAAMLLDRAAILRIVSALRRYRAASESMLAARYTDGEVDGATLSVFEEEVKGIEEDGQAGNHFQGVGR